MTKTIPIHAAHDCAVTADPRAHRRGVVRAAAVRCARGCAFAWLAATLGSCTSSTPPLPTSAPKCVDRGVGALAVLPLGDACVRVERARVRQSAVWRDLTPAELEISSLDGFDAHIAGHADRAEAFELTLTGFPGKSILQEGFQSWSFSGATQIPATVPRDADGSIAARAAFTGDPTDEVIGVSYGLASIGDPAAPEIAIGASDSTIATTAIAATRGADDTTVTVLYGAAREPLPADASGVVHLPTILLAATGSDLPFAKPILEALGPTARAPQRPIGGWFSWNELFDTIDEKAILANADVVAKSLAPKGMPLVEIDDGWEVAWGDWQANAKFPHGMDGVAKSITDRGLKPGVWLAPFLVDVDSAAGKALDPSLTLHGDDGKPLRHRPAASAHTYFVLDGTNPAAMDVVGASIRALRTAGYHFFKLDYLYAASLPAHHSIAGATGTQALRSGLATLRTAMGDDAIFNACGAPILPVIGLADSLRIGSDTAFRDVSLGWAEIVFAARSTNARSWLQAVLWLDGDQVQVRAPYTLAEAKVAAYVAALAGPAYSLGDDLTKLPAERLAIALDPLVLSVAHARTTPVEFYAMEPLETPADRIVASPILDTIATPNSTVAPPPTVFALSSAAVTTLTFSWTDVHSVDVVLGP